MMDQVMMEHFTGAALKYLAGRSPRSKREIQQAIQADGNEMTEVIHHLRGAGRIEVVMEDDGVPRYTLSETAKADPQPSAPDPLPKSAPPATKQVAPAMPEVTAVTDLALALVADGVPRTWDQIAEGIGLEKLPAAVEQRLNRRMSRVGFSGHKGLYALGKKEKKQKAPEPVKAKAQDAEFPVPATEPAKPCGGSCGCHKTPAARSSAVLDATLAEASGLAEEALSEYLAILGDRRLNSLISAAQSLRDAIHGH